MQSVFEIGRAVFNPDQVKSMQGAMRYACTALSPRTPLPRETERKLGKLIVHMARERSDAGLRVSGEALGAEAALFISNLRSLSLLA